MRAIVSYLIYSIFLVLYKPRVKGREFLPRNGGALIVANHTSYLDTIIISWLTRRPVRFLVSEAVSKQWFVKPLAWMTDAIPVERSHGPRAMVQALQEARKEIEAGGMIGIFAEGAISRNGQLLPFQRGYERIIKGLDVPVIPLAIDGALESKFSLFQQGKTFKRHPFWKRRQINVVIGEPTTTKVTAWHMRKKVEGQLADAFDMRREEHDVLHREAIRSLRRNWRVESHSDHTTPPIPNFKLLAAIVALGWKLKPTWKNSEFVGLMLPPSIGGIAANVAVSLSGRVPVNLNYTASKTIIGEICEQTGVTSVITSKQFLEKGGLELPDGIEPIYLEDAKESISGGDRLKALLAGLLLPVSILEKSMGSKKRAHLDDLATLLFSSGSTGKPKGVMLTHWAVLSNAMGTVRRVYLDEDARLLGVLPYFHSFGYMAGLWLPLVTSVTVTSYANPLDARTIAKLVERDKVSLLFATPTFLANYTARAKPEQFASVRFVITGAEKLRTSVSEAFEKKFGIKPVEAFGGTETSPAATVAGFDADFPGGVQVGSKPGCVGTPISGVTVRIVDIDTGEELGPNEPGLIEVRGCNIMKGYYRMPEKTAEVLKDGWYSMGDVAKIDDDGFVFITDRLARFSKIGGEMVPHVRVEEALHAALETGERYFGVTGIPCERKGEKIVVLYTCSEEDARKAHEAISGSDSDFPSLWIPKFSDFHPIEEIPVLGSGKTDLMTLKNTALEASTQTAAK